jgi:type I restriction enzyme S subunit
MLSDKTLRITFGAVDKAYFLQYLRSHTGRNEIMKRSTGNQESMRNIGQDRIRSIIVPVCSKAEMSEIVGRLEKTFMHIEAMEAGITTELQRSEFLRQSILKRAFSGQLVPQDPNDEPASRLLERIRAEKVAQASKQKPTKHTGKKRVTA